jgi:hypothetical protein
MREPMSVYLKAFDKSSLKETPFLANMAGKFTLRVIKLGIVLQMR